MNTNLRLVLADDADADAAAGEDLNRVLLIGDSLVTDIAFAASADIASCLCLTGITDAPRLRDAFLAREEDKINKIKHVQNIQFKEREGALPNFVIDTAANLIPQ